VPSFRIACPDSDDPRFSAGSGTVPSADCSASYAFFQDVHATMKGMAAGEKVARSLMIAFGSAPVFFPFFYGQIEDQGSVR
jgi:hypothetical protein